MTTTLDRLFFFAYVRNYLIVLSSLLSLYVLIDLFTNLDDFSKGSMVENAFHIVSYYSIRLVQIFDKLAEAITLIAAMFTIAWIQRNNELLPQLSAGISTQRVIRPVLFGALATLLLGPLNQEFVIPVIADELTKDRDDPRSERAVVVKGGFDSTGVHLEGIAGFRNERRVAGLFATFPETSSAGLIHISSREAHFFPGDDKHPRGWELNRTTPEHLERLPKNLEQISHGKYFLRVEELDFDAVTRNANWYSLSSIRSLWKLLAGSDARRQPAVAVAFHRRITRILVGSILVIMGLGVILRDQNRHVFINTGLCLVLCGIFYIADLGCKSLGEADFLSPALAAWLPVLIFGPFSLLLLDSVHT